MNRHYNEYKHSSDYKNYRIVYLHVGNVRRKNSRMKLA